MKVGQGYTIAKYFKTKCRVPVSVLIKYVIVKMWIEIVREGLRSKDKDRERVSELVRVYLRGEYKGIWYDRGSWWHTDKYHVLSKMQTFIIIFK